MRKLIVLLLLTLICSCARETPAISLPQEADDSGYPGYDINPETGLPANPSKRRLPDSVKIISDKKENFGIDVSALTPEQASIVHSAWSSYQAILKGGYPDCPMAPFAPSDGGTTIYFCDGYDIARIHSLAGTTDNPGYNFGPSLHLLNGQHVEHRQFYTTQEMADIDRAAP